MQHKMPEAFEHVAEAVRTDPASIDARVLYGRLLAGESLFADAIPQFEAAVQLTGGRDPGLLDLLGGCYAASGRVDEGIQTARRALALAEQQGNVQLVETLKARVAAYESLRRKTPQ